MSQRTELSPEAVQALGTVSPELAWEQVQDLVAGAIEEQPEASLKVLQEADWPGGDLRDLLELLGQLNPVDGINYLVESNDLLLNNADRNNKLDPLMMLGAVLNFLTTNDRWLSQGSI